MKIFDCILNVIEWAQDRNQWRTLLHAAMNVHKIHGISCVAEEPLASQEGLKVFAIGQVEIRAESVVGCRSVSLRNVIRLLQEIFGLYLNLVT